MKRASTASSSEITIRPTLGPAYAAMEDEIRRRAYEIFCGRTHDAGSPMSDWVHAQDQVVFPLKVTIKEQKKGIVAECRPPATNLECVEVAIKDRTLHICGVGHPQRDAGETEFFFQTMSLPADVELEGFAAKQFKNGKIRLTFPKA